MFNAHTSKTGAAHSVSTRPPGIGNQINEFNLTDECLLTFKSIQRNPNQNHEGPGRGLLALTIVHAVEFSRIGSTSPTRHHTQQPEAPRSSDGLDRQENLSEKNRWSMSGSGR